MKIKQNRLIPSIQCLATRYLEFQQVGPWLCVCYSWNFLYRSFFYYAQNFSYYVSIMLYAFHLLLCLKLCWHNWLKSSGHLKMYLTLFSPLGRWNLINSFVLRVVKNDADRKLFFINDSCCKKLKYIIYVKYNWVTSQIIMSLIFCIGFFFALVMYICVHV